MDNVNDSLKYIKYFEYDKLGEHRKYNKYKKLEHKLNGHLFDCPNCARRGVKVSIDRDLLTDTLFIRAFCRFCDVYSIMQVSLLKLEDVNFSFTSNMIDDVLYNLKERSKDTSKVDLDAMIDKDWELAGG